MSITLKDINERLYRIEGMLLEMQEKLQMEPMTENTKELVFRTNFTEERLLNYLEALLYFEGEVRNGTNGYPYSLWLPNENNSKFWEKYNELKNAES